MRASRSTVGTTINKPWSIGFLDYAMGDRAPGICDYSQVYQAASHLLLSHGETVQRFRQGGYQNGINL